MGVHERPAPDGPPRFVLPEWATYGVAAGITARADGFNLGLATPEPATRVLARWRSLQEFFAPSFPTIHLGLQVHGARILCHGRAPAGWIIREGVDGHVTREAGALLTVTVADCVPVYIVHPRSRTVALLHAGWRGIAAGILETGLRTICETAAGDVAELLMHCGVGICGECYEVGPEVPKALGRPVPAGRSRFDLRAELVRRAEAAGVGGVTVSAWCTAHDREAFFSHRASGGADGRMVAWLGVPAA